MTIQSKPTVGLFGLSGNPTHKGHIAAVRAARETLGLDRVLLLINPHNPLKDPSIYAPYEHREMLARLEVEDSPEVHDYLSVNDFEKQLRDRGIANETITTLGEFEKVFSDVEPVWLMGADNLAGIHTWGGNWNHILEHYMVAVFAREGNDDAAATSVAARAYRDEQVDPHELLRSGGGHWSFIDHVDHVASSTEIRKQVARGEVPAHIAHTSHEYILRNGLYIPKVSEAIAS